MIPNPGWSKLTQLKLSSLHQFFPVSMLSLLYVDHLVSAVVHLKMERNLHSVHIQN